MAYETKDMTFSLFKQGQKAKDNSPDYTGSIKINGVEYKLAAWIATSKSGLKYQQGKVSEIGAKPETPQQRAFNAQAPINRDLDDTPF